MRPRALIELVRYCRSHAINLRHERIEVVDIEKGEEAYSSDLLTATDFEISDILAAVAIFCMSLLKRRRKCLDPQLARY